MRRGAIVLLLLLVPACAGPQKPVHVGFKEVPSDVVLGAQTSPTPAPVVVPVPSGLAVLPLPPAVVALPPPPFDDVRSPQPVPAATVESCPAADPLAAPNREAPATVSVPPAAATYVFGNVGSYTISGADARTGAFPATSLRTVGHVQRASASSFSFYVSELLGDTTTTTTYDVVGDSLLPAALPSGLYIKAVTSRRGSATSTFTPTPELQLAGFPLVRGASVTASGVDAQSATSMQFTATVTGKARVDACGTPLDAWVLDLTAGKLVSPTQNLDFTATYDVGTQYGGILLRERTAFTGTDGSDGVSRTDTATIRTMPKVP